MRIDLEKLRISEIGEKSPKDGIGFIIISVSIRVDIFKLNSHRLLTLFERNIVTNSQYLSKSHSRDSSNIFSPCIASL